MSCSLPDILHASITNDSLKCYHDLLWATCPLSLMDSMSRQRGFWTSSRCISARSQLIPANILAQVNEMKVSHRRKNDPVTPVTPLQLVFNQVAASFVVASHWLDLEIESRYRRLQLDNDLSAAPPPLLLRKPFIRGSLAFTDWKVFSAEHNHA